MRLSRNNTVILKVIENGICLDRIPLKEKCILCFNICPLAGFMCDKVAWSLLNMKKLEGSKLTKESCAVEIM